MLRLLMINERMSDLLKVAHLSWATWAIRSRSLICLERSERIAHIWYERNEQMSEFPALLIFKKHISAWKTYFRKREFENDVLQNLEKNLVLKKSLQPTRGQQ